MEPCNHAANLDYRVFVSHVSPIACRWVQVRGRDVCASHRPTNIGNHHRTIPCECDECAYVEAFNAQGSK